MAVEWKRIEPADAGFAADLGERVDQVISDGRAPGLHGVVVIRHGGLVLERYGQGEDFKWNESLGTVTFGPGTLHDIRSVTKSVTTLVYGIALGKGLVPEPSERLMGYFPKYQDLADKNAELTVEHALTMRLGLDWNENVPYTGPENSEIAMEMAPDRYRYILEQPVVEPPGTRWSYSSAASALIGGLISAGTGRPLDEYARATLFEPLGITEYEWMAGTDGVPSPASGLRLSPRSLAAIGQLVLDGGRDLVPGDWIERMLTPHARIEGGSAYGYQWYMGSPDDWWYAGFGNGGQRLFVVPRQELVIVMSAGEYNNAGSSSDAMHEAITAAIVT